MNRPLRPTHLADLVDTLRALADEYEADHAQQVQHSIGTETDAGYPAMTSGAGGNGGGAASSRPEALTIQPDPTATRAATLAALQADIARTVPVVYRGLRARDPNRKIQTCPRCNHPIGEGMSRCNRMIDGRRCGVCRNTGNGCPRDGQPLEAGEKMRDGECHACASRTYRTRKTARPEPTGAVASVANLVDGMADIEEMQP